MLETEFISGEDGIKEWVMELHGQWIFPPFLFIEDKYKPVVIGLRVDGVPAGIAYGVIEHGGSLFFLHQFFIKKEYRRQEILLYLLEAVLKAAREFGNIEGAVWKYNKLEGETDPRKKLLHKIPFCQAEKMEQFIQFRIKTVDFSYLRKFQWYDPMLWKKKGCLVCRWSEYDKSWKDSIREMEKRNVTEKDYLSPFIEDGDGEAEERTSFVLAHKETKEPLGWIVCQQFSEKEVKIRRFFIYAKARKYMIGPSFSTYVLEEIASLYEYLYFDVVPGNRQMEMFANVYCKPILDLSCIDCNLKINFKKF